MHPVITLILIISIALIGYILPKKYNEYFFNAHHRNATSMPLAVATAVASALWLLFIDADGFWYWFLLIASILLYIISTLYVIHNGLQVQANTMELAFAVFAQILATAGTIIIIIGIVWLFVELLGGKKKKR